MKFIHSEQLDLPENFREEFLAKIFHLIKSSESAVLLAPSGMGKTLTLRLIENQQFQKHHLPDTHIICHTLDLLENPFTDIAAILDSIKNLSSDSRLLIIADNAEVFEQQSQGQEIIRKIKTLREKARPQITFLLASERNFINAPAFQESSGIKSILMENVLYVPPLNATDALAFCQTLAKQLDASLPPKTLEQIATQSGGSPRLIKRLIKLAKNNTDPATDDKLAFDVQVLQDFLQANPSYHFTSPLLNTPSQAHDSQPTQDKVGNLTFKHSLTKQEYSLAQVLLDAKGELVNREDMIKAIWPKNLYETSEHALDQMIHRLKKKLESATPKCELITLRGRGARLTL